MTVSDVPADRRYVAVRSSGPIGTITLDRPEARNAIDREFAEEIDAAFSRLEADPAVQVLVLAANGPAFCAGADLKAIAANRPGGLLRDTGFAGITKRRREKPLIAAVEGPALAGGCEIVLACDLVVASPGATFGLPEVKRALIAGAGGLIQLPQRIPRNVALEMILTGEPISAERGYELGLVNRLTQPGQALAAAEALAGVIARNAPLAVRASRRVVLEVLAEGELAGWKLNDALLESIVATDDVHEGASAFVEKRDPNWVGH
jgi:enoyl-CoA hydratase